MRKKMLYAMVLLLGLVACAPLTEEAGGPADERRSRQGAESDQSCAYAHFLWGKAAEAAGRPEEAIFHFEQALECDPAAEYVMRNLAMSLIRTDKRQQAIAWVNKILAARPDDVGAQSLLANLYVSIGETGQAEAAYRAILAKDPGNQNVMLMLGSLYAGNRQYEKARAQLEELVRIAPESYAGHYYLAKLYREMRLGPKAAAAYTKALSLNWSAPLAYEAADFYESLSRYAESAKLYRRILDDDPADERARGLLANSYLQQNKIDAALAELRELRQTASETLRVDLTIGRVLLEAKRYDAAIAHLTRILAEDPGQVSIRSLLVLTYYQKGDKVRARKMLAEVRPGMAGYEEAVLMLARLLQDEKDLAGAEKVLRQAIAEAESERKVVFYVALAALYRERQELPKAYAVFDEAQQALPTDSKLRFEYGLFLERIGNTDAALAKMHEVLALEPRNPYALNYVGYTWADRGERLEEARAYIEEAVSQRPEDGFIRDSLGWVYYRLGDYERAVRELEKAVELANDEDATIYDHLGDAYARLKRYAEAAGAYDRAAELYDEPAKREAVRRKREALPLQ
ncbi:MAG: tetratricopeptide repeat protein [Thermodesulfobacteriota bacterium]